MKSTLRKLYMAQDDQESQIVDHFKKNENKEGRGGEYVDPVPTPTVELREEHDECFHYLDSPSYCS